MKTKQILNDSNVFYWSSFDPTYLNVDRLNPDEPQVVQINETETIGNFNNKWLTVIVAHGWRGDRNSLRHITNGIYHIYLMMSIIGENCHFNTCNGSINTSGLDIVTKMYASKLFCLNYSTCCSMCLCLL